MRVNLESLVKLISEPTPAGITRWERKKRGKAKAEELRWEQGKEGRRTSRGKLKINHLIFCGHQFIVGPTGYKWSSDTAPPLHLRLRNASSQHHVRTLPIQIQREGGQQLSH